MGTRLLRRTCSCGGHRPGLAASSIPLGGVRSHRNGVGGLWEQPRYYGLLSGRKKDGFPSGTGALNDCTL